jgi:hypothetical protein
VFERPLRYLAVLISAVVLVSFAMFAVDEFRGASNETQSAIAAEESTSAIHAAAPGTAAGTAQGHTQVRRAIDRLDRVVTSPFTGLVAGSSSTWVRHGVPALLALLFWGLGFAFLARFAKGSPGARRPPPRRAGV